MAVLDYTTIYYYYYYYYYLCIIALGLCHHTVYVGHMPAYTHCTLRSECGCPLQ
jgi:hypothetical protein